MKFYHIHIPKTGGISLCNYAERNGLNWNTDGGHRGFLERSIPKGSVLITSLRCPIKQTLSIYSFWKHGTKNNKRPLHNHQLPPFSEWIRNPKELLAPWGNIHKPSNGKPGGKWHWFPDLYVSFFGDGDFDRAVSNIRSIDHVLDTSQLTRQFNAVVAKYDLPPFEGFANKSKPLEISMDDKEHIKRQRELDFEICRMFKVQTTL